MFVYGGAGGKNGGTETGIDDKFVSGGKAGSIPNLGQAGNNRDRTKTGDRKQKFAVVLEGRVALQVSTNLLEDRPYVAVGDGSFTALVEGRVKIL